MADLVDTVTLDEDVYHNIEKLMKYALDRKVVVDEGGKKEEKGVKEALKEVAGKNYYLVSLDSKRRGKGGKGRNVKFIKELKNGEYTKYLEDLKTGNIDRTFDRMLSEGKTFGFLEFLLDSEGEVYTNKGVSDNGKVRDKLGKATYIVGPNGVAEIPGYWFDEKELLRRVTGVKEVLESPPESDGGTSVKIWEKTYYVRGSLDKEALDKLMSYLPSESGDPSKPLKSGTADSSSMSDKKDSGDIEESIIPTDTPSTDELDSTSYTDTSTPADTMPTDIPDEESGGDIPESAGDSTDAVPTPSSSPGPDDTPSDGKSTKKADHTMDGYSDIFGTAIEGMTDSSSYTLEYTDSEIFRYLATKSEPSSYTGKFARIKGVWGKLKDKMKGDTERPKLKDVSKRKLGRNGYKPKIERKYAYQLSPDELSKHFKKGRKHYIAMPQSTNQIEIVDVTDVLKMYKETGGKVKIKTKPMRMLKGARYSTERYSPTTDLGIQAYVEDLAKTLSGEIAYVYRDQIRREIANKTRDKTLYAYRIKFTKSSGRWEAQVEDSVTISDVDQYVDFSSKTDKHGHIREYSLKVKWTRWKDVDKYRDVAKVMDWITKKPDSDADAEMTVLVRGYGEHVDIVETPVKYR